METKIHTSFLIKTQYWVKMTISKKNHGDCSKNDKLVNDNQ